MFIGYYYDEIIKKILKQIKYHPLSDILNNFDIFYNLFLNNKNFKDLEILSKNIDFILPLPIYLKENKEVIINLSFLQKFF